MLVCKDIENIQKAKAELMFLIGTLDIISTTVKDKLSNLLTSKNLAFVGHHKLSVRWSCPNDDDRIVNNKIESSKQSEIEIAALQLLIHLQVNFLLPWKACGVSSGPADSANEMQIWRETKDDSIVAAETAWRWPELWS